jgi:hypothetical protein
MPSKESVCLFASFRVSGAQSIACLLLAMVASLSGMPSAQCKPNQPFHYVETFKLAMKLRQEADDTLFDNMEAITEWLTYFKQRHDRFPEAGAEQLKAEEFFKRYLKNNPYCSSPDKRAQETRPCKVRFEYNTQMNDELIQSWKNAAPPSWKGEPGTIVVTTNTENRVVLWGTSADGRPLLDPKTGKVRMIVADIFGRTQAAEADEQ